MRFLNSRYFVRFICLFFQFFSVAFVTSQEVFFPGQEERFYELPQSWSPIEGKSKATTLRILVSTLDSSASKLRSFSGIYTIDYESTISSSIAKDLNIPVTTGDIIRKSSFNMQIFSDFQSEQTFRSRRNANLAFESNGNIINTENISSLDVNSIVTKKDYVFSNDQQRLPTIPELPDFPGTNNRRVAWREPPEATINRHITELINPKEYFDWMAWGNIGKIPSKHVSLFEATDEGGTKWFRLCQQLTSSGGKRDLNIFWNENAGLHPVCRLYVDNGTRRLIKLTQVKWKRIDSIFIPVESLDVVYENSGKLSFRRKMTLSNVEINKPISQKEFAFSALGLDDGDILVDKIKTGVYTIKDDKPVFLAKFYEQYQPTHERSINRYRLIITALGVAMIVLGIYLKLRRKKVENSE